MTTEDREAIVRLETKLDQVIENLKVLSKHDDRISNLEKNDCVKDEQIKTSKSEIEKLRNTNSAWNFGNTIAIIIGTILGVSIK